MALQALARKRATPSQGHLSQAARAENVRNAFHVPKVQIKCIKNKQVLLVDDVLTTGATANACAAALLQAGASAVRVLALARVSKIGG